MDTSYPCFADVDEDNFPFILFVRWVPFQLLEVVTQQDDLATGDKLPTHIPSSSTLESDRERRRVFWKRMVMYSTALPMDDDVVKRVDSYLALRMPCDPKDFSLRWCAKEYHPALCSPPNQHQRGVNVPIAQLGQSLTDVRDSSVGPEATSYCASAQELSFHKDPFSFTSASALTSLEIDFLLLQGWLVARYLLYQWIRSGEKQQQRMGVASQYLQSLNPLGRCANGAVSTADVDSNHLYTLSHSRSGATVGRCGVSRESRHSRLTTTHSAGVDLSETIGWMASQHDSTVSGEEGRLLVSASPSCQTFPPLIYRAAFSSSEWRELEGQRTTKMRGWIRFLQLWGLKECVIKAFGNIQTRDNVVEGSKNLQQQTISLSSSSVLQQSGEELSMNHFSFLSYPKSECHSVPEFGMQTPVCPVAAIQDAVIVTMSNPQMSVIHPVLSISLPLSPIIACWTGGGNIGAKEGDTVAHTNTLHGHLPTSKPCTYWKCWVTSVLVLPQPPPPPSPHAPNLAEDGRDAVGKYTIKNVHTLTDTELSQSSVLSAVVLMNHSGSTALKKSLLNAEEEAEAGSACPSKPDSSLINMMMHLQVAGVDGNRNVPLN